MSWQALARRPTSESAFFDATQESMHNSLSNLTFGPAETGRRKSQSCGRLARTENAEVWSKLFHTLSPAASRTSASIRRCTACIWVAVKMPEPEPLPYTGKVPCLCGQRHGESDRICIELLQKPLCRCRAKGVDNGEATGEICSASRRQVVECLLSSGDLLKILPAGTPLASSYKFQRSLAFD